MTRRLLRAQVDVENYFQRFYCILLRIALKRPYNKWLVKLVRSVIMGKSQTPALMY